ncbi:LacI family transcriptional regulator [Leifsonia sp. Root227]|uniref:LacI family DNA-binding transcriptional regulator n=1 Tax=Leifsonia sp. Root227 TaxID=1736496 RepID=UPI0007004C5B|nr:LacI family DNA-binding transcriptional regulator [Leifsonia sp. Root227]KRC51566.1 LacI family transcriptional regulator [Leifsonia sp. Root227]
MPSVSVKDVAALAGVSVGTVSNVLNRPERVAEATVVRVQTAIQKLGFVRNDAARQLRAGHSRAIGLIILDIANPFFAAIARGAEDHAAHSSLSVLLGNSDEKVERETTYLDLFEQQRVNGVLISPVGDVIPHLRRLRDHGIPSVLVDRTSPDTSFSSVSVDDVIGGELAVAHLLEIGRRRIAYVGGPFEIRQASDRLEGARRAVAAYPDASLEVLPVRALSVLEGRAAGLDIAARAASERPDAIFAANDLLATGLLQALFMQSTIAVPDEIALIGYDDIDFASAAVVPLSSIRQPSSQIGETAVQILLEESADPGIQPRQIVYQPELVVRASTVAST